MEAKSDLSLPAVPPPPTGERIQPRARGLAGLIAAQDSAVICHRSDQLTAMVIVLGGRVIDAVAQTRAEVIKGNDVLDEISDLPIGELQVIGVEPRLAQALPVYWRAPGATQEVVEALRRPGRRGAVLARSPAHGTGIVVFDERGVVASFLDGEVKDHAIEEVFRDPEAVISARAEPLPGSKPVDVAPTVEDAALEPPQPREPVVQPVPGGFAEPAPAAAPNAPFEPLGHAPEHERRPFGAPAPFGGPSGGAGPSPDAGAGGAPAPAASFPARPQVSAPDLGAWRPDPGFEPTTSSYPFSSSLEDQAAPANADPVLDERRQAIVQLLERELGKHAETVSEPFRTAPSTEALIGSAQALGSVTVRLISPARMLGLSQQATAIARGEQVLS